MITTVQFLRAPVSRAAGENYTKDLMTGATVTVVHQFDNATVTEDLDQVLVVPHFDGYSDCNMVAFNDCYYWILSAVTSTKYAKSLEFVITFNATASMVTLGDRLAGRWERTPTYNGLQENIFNTELENITTSVTLPQSLLPSYQWTEAVSGSEYNAYAFWCQVTVKSSSGSGLTVYGFPVGYSEGWLLGGAPIYYSYEYSSGEERPDVYYPILREVIGEPHNALPIESGDDIVDISVSNVCPFRYSWYTNLTYGPRLTLFGLRPVVKEYTKNSQKFAVYDISAGSYEESDFTEVTTDSFRTDAVRNSGYFVLKDVYGNTIYTMPGNRSNVIRYRTFADINGLYCEVFVNGERLIIPEGKLPWLSDSYSQYQAYSLQFDRQMMESQIRAAKDGMVAGLAESAINGVLTGALVGVAGGPAGVAAGVATGLVGAASTVYNQYLTEQQTRREQQITERRAYAQPDTFINSSYGMNYIRSSVNGSRTLTVTAQLPANYTANMDASYHLQYGYNAGGTTNIYPISKGYWQGLLFKQATLKGERLVNEFMNGQIIG